MGAAVKPGSMPPIKNVLNMLPKLDGDQRLVAAPVDLAKPLERSSVEPVAKS
jgi:hypothetical protein